MKKSDVIERMHIRTGMTKRDISTFLDELTAVISELLVKADENERIPVLPQGLTVYKKWKAATKARTMDTGITDGPVQVPAKPAHWVIKASPLSKLKTTIIPKKGKSRKK